jgi:hypothetical protein
MLKTIDIMKTIKNLVVCLVFFFLSCKKDPVFIELQGGYKAISESSISIDMMFNSNKNKLLDFGLVYSQSEKIPQVDNGIRISQENSQPLSESYYRIQINDLDFEKELYVSTYYQKKDDTYEYSIPKKIALPRIEIEKRIGYNSNNQIILFGTYIRDIDFSTDSKLFFEYGLSNSYNNIIDVNTDGRFAGNDNDEGKTNFNAVINSNLEDGQTYHYRVSVDLGGFILHSEDKSFVFNNFNDSIPQFSEFNTFSIGSNVGIPACRINTNGIIGQVSINYGEDWSCSYSSIPATQYSIVSQNDSYWSSQLNGLKNNYLVFWKAKISNDNFDFYSEMQNFKTNN